MSLCSEPLILMDFCAVGSVEDLMVANQVETKGN